MPEADCSLTGPENGENYNLEIASSAGLNGMDHRQHITEGVTGLI